MALNPEKSIVLFC